MRVYVPIESSLLKEVCYVESEQKLYVRFKKSPKVACYLDFPKCEYDALLEGETVGKYFYHHIRSIYAFEYVDETL